jgi:uncharacterized protein (TIGR03067 family)
MKTTPGLKSCLFASLLLACVAGCEKQEAQKETLQGRWSGFETGSTQKITLSFEGNRFAYSDVLSNEIGSGTFVVNDSVQPKQLDLTFEQIPAPEYVGQVALAIYQLRRDELRIAGSEPGSTLRPANIAGGEGVRTFTFKRE